MDEHSTNLVIVLQSRLANISMGFKEALEIRTEVCGIRHELLEPSKKGVIVNLVRLFLQMAEHASIKEEAGSVTSVESEQSIPAASHYRSATSSTISSATPNECAIISPEYVKVANWSRPYDASTTSLQQQYISERKEVAIHTTTEPNASILSATITSPTTVSQYNGYGPIQ